MPLGSLGLSLGGGPEITPSSANSSVILRGGSNDEAMKIAVIAIVLLLVWRLK